MPYRLPRFPHRRCRPPFANTTSCSSWVASPWAEAGRQVSDLEKWGRSVVVSHECGVGGVGAGQLLTQGQGLAVEPLGLVGLSGGAGQVGQPVGGWLSNRTNLVVFEYSWRLLAAAIGTRNRLTVSENNQIRSVAKPTPNPQNDHATTLYPTVSPGAWLAGRSG
jgi:hypothetical protein